MLILFHLFLLFGLQIAGGFAEVLVTTQSVVRKSRQKSRDHDPNEPAHLRLESKVAEKLARSVRVLCWVLTHPANHRARANHVKHTWGRRCHRLLFISSSKYAKLPTVALPVQEGRRHLWLKTRAAFQYVYEHHRNDADWFLKAEDDTYMIMENLRHLLSRYKWSEPLYFGCRFKLPGEKSYMNGGAGYVLSREALDRFVNQTLNQPSDCRLSREGTNTSEAVKMGKCLEGIGVRAVDTRDEYGRGRFFPAHPTTHLFPRPPQQPWYWEHSYYPLHKEGESHVSDYAISFHYMKPEDMYAFDYFLYHARPYGISRA